jgi:hypothetical protein
VVPRSCDRQLPVHPRVGPQGRTCSGGRRIPTSGKADFALYGSSASAEVRKLRT